MKFEISNEELVDFVTNNYTEDYAKKAIDNIDEFAELVQEQIDGQDHILYEIFDYCIHEAIQELHLRDVRDIVS